MAGIQRKWGQKVICVFLCVLRENSSAVAGVVRLAEITGPRDKAAAGWAAGREGQAGVRAGGEGSRGGSRQILGNLKKKLAFTLVLSLCLVCCRITLMPTLFVSVFSCTPSSAFTCFHYYNVFIPDPPLF